MNHPHSFHSPRQRPPWWPDNEPWPPHVRMRRSFFRRIGCLFALFNLAGLAVLAAAFALVARWLGLADFPFDLKHFLIPSVAGALIIIVTLAGLGVLSLRRVVNPLDDLLKAADHIGQGDYSVRVQEKGPREVRSLGRAFNEMASRLDLLDERRRNLLADVTHELRSPLTVMQGNLEGMLDGVYPADETNLSSLLEETKVLSRLVEDLRTLSLAESGALQLKKEATDLGMLIHETVAAFQAQAEAAKVTLSVEMATDLPWLSLDPGRLRQVLSNLLANALRYTPAGGRVSVHYQQAHGRALLEVQDSGPGIPANEMAHVFDRFYKSADSGGMGLGLAIAKKLVEAHDGTISAESAAGRGTTMRIDLPGG
jgi:two-component system sensor histidine kinase BaeS